MLLEVKNLTTEFTTGRGIVRAVNDISYCLGEGQSLGIVGESGCGKSVSALSLMRLVPDPPGRIVRGEVLFEGLDLMKMSEDEICGIRGNRIAMIFQEPMTSMNPVLDIGFQVTEPLLIHRKAGRKDALRACIELLRKVQMPGAPERLHAYPHQLSGGMRQRVMISMSLACDPRLIIADEPTTALDVTIQAELLDLMKDLTREKGTALILITHNLGIVARYTHRVMVMYAGRIVEKALTRSLFRNPAHPYTRALLASVPRLDHDLGQRLVSIEGQPPDLDRLPAGCAFHPRCTKAFDRCREERPELKTISEDHEAACWLYE